MLYWTVHEVAENVVYAGKVVEAAVPLDIVYVMEGGGTYAIKVSDEQGSVTVSWKVDVIVLVSCKVPVIVTL